MFRWLVIELRVYPLEDFADALHLIVVEFGAVRLLAVLDSVVERGHVRWCIYIDPLEFRQVHATHHDGVGHALQYHCHHCGNNAHEHQTCQGFRGFHSLIFLFVILLWFRFLAQNYNCFCVVGNNMGIFVLWQQEILKNYIIETILLKKATFKRGDNAICRKNR